MTLPIRIDKNKIDPRSVHNPEFREAAREQMRLKNQLKDANQWLKLETKP